MTVPPTKRPAGPATAGITTIPELMAMLGSRIPASRFGRGRVLMIEIRDGLEDSAEAYRRAGMGDSVAERRAVEDFGIGEIDRISRECRAELGTAATLRAAIVVSAGYLLILSCWALYYALFGEVTRFSDSTAVGNGFTVIGAITVVAGLGTYGFLRYRLRRTDRVRPITAGFVGLTTAALLATYALALLSHRPPHEPGAWLVAGTIVQALSGVVTAVMVLAVGNSLWRAAYAWRSEGIRTVPARNR